MYNIISIFWFRQDLRLMDNEGLFQASKQGKVLPIYILDDYTLGSVSRWWLHNSLCKLNIALNNKLFVFNGNPEDTLLKILKLYSIKRVYWNRCYEPCGIDRDKKIKNLLQDYNVIVQTYNGSLLCEPWNILKEDRSPYRVFSYFYHQCIKKITVRKPLPKPSNLHLIEFDNHTKIEDLKLLPKISWYNKLEKHWNIGEEGAIRKFDDFLNKKIDSYNEDRNFPCKDSVSRLSAYLHFGEISVNYVWYKVKSLENFKCNINYESFYKELLWREFSYYLLYHFPRLLSKNFNNKFDNFPWRDNIKLLECWQNGKTGIPIIDAGMRELWQTGYMHNRVRMIVGSFLVKNLLLHWSYGKSWFWDCLVDADLANNSVSWQWVAGCGADAAPYFRIFNPVIQAKRFDPSGVYIRKFIPELRLIPDKYLFTPWEAPENILYNSAITLGKNYPKPIVDLNQSRINALRAYKNL